LDVLLAVRAAEAARLSRLQVRVVNPKRAMRVVNPKRAMRVVRVGEGVG
jgi:hypothetical protein